MIRGIFQAHDLSHLKAGLEVTFQERMESGNNLANAETPDFQSKETDFRALLMPGAPGAPERGQAFQMYLESLREEDQGFNLEHEMRRMAQAGMASKAYSKLLIRRYQDLRTVMREGR